MRNILFFAALGCFILSCNPDEVVTNQPTAAKTETSQDVKIINGVLQFSSKQHLLNVVQEIEKMENMETWYKGTGFRSLLQRQNELKEADLDRVANSGDLGNLDEVLFFRDDNGELVLSKIVEDPRFAAVLSEKSFVIVEDVVYHIGHKGVAYIPVANRKDVLDRFLENPSMEGASFEKTEAEYFRSARTSATNDNTIIDPYNSKRRIVAEFVRHNSIVYISLVVKVRYQKKNWIGWSGTNCYSMNFSANGVFMEAGVPFPFSGSRSGSNVEEISMFVSEVYNLSLDWVLANGSGSFRGGSGDPSSTSFTF